MHYSACGGIIGLSDNLVIMVALPSTNRSDRRELLSPDFADAFDAFEDAFAFEQAGAEALGDLSRMATEAVSNNVVDIRSAIDKAGAIKIEEEDYKIAESA